MSKRSYGTGSLSIRHGKWFGRWYVGDRERSRALGPVREPGTRNGLTRKQAEARLRRLIEDGRDQPTVVERVTVGEAGARLIAHLTTLGRKRSTVQSYESYLRIHLVPYFGDRPLAEITRHEVESFMGRCRSNGQSVKSTLNYLGLLHGIFEHAERERWVSGNPCKHAAKPRDVPTDADIRYLDDAELNALLRSVPDDDLGRVERVLYLTAATTGLRQGELLALRWGDVDWPARRIRVRRSFVRGEYTTPKSKRSTRAVPMADRVAGQLDQLHQDSAYGADNDLVFAHPHTGKPIDRSRLLKRFKRALAAAGVREVRFHDLRHTFGTRMAAEGVPMRALQEMMGHREYKTTLIYADYAPSAQETEWVEAAFGSVGEAESGSVLANSDRSRDAAADGIPSGR